MRHVSKTTAYIIATAYSEAHAALIVKALSNISVEDTTAVLFGE